MKDFRIYLVGGTGDNTHYRQKEEIWGTHEHKEK